MKIKNLDTGEEVELEDLGDEATTSSSTGTKPQVGTRRECKEGG